MRIRRRISAVLAMMLCATAWLDARQDTVTTRARALAGAGQRGEAIRLLQDSVARSDNSDTRVLLGTVLSWEGRYDEARHELETVLSKSPTHGDALPASINVELWSGHPERAEELARRGLRQNPTDPHYLLARARALISLKRSTEARDTLDRLLAIDPRNAQGKALRRSLLESLRVWQVRAGTSYDAFSDRRAGWRESQVSVSRATPVGSIVARGARAERFGQQDDQFELEMYPSFRPGTYAYVAAAYAPDALLYPEYRYAAEIYQSLGAGFEGSAGFRKLGFGSGVTIYTGSLSKYYGNWLFTGRAYVTPDAVGTSRSYHGSFRRYIGGAGTYVGLRYGRGAWRDEPRNLSDFNVLDSDVLAGDVTVVLLGRLELSVSGSYSREDRVERQDLRQYSVSSGVGFRF